MVSYTLKIKQPWDNQGSQDLSLNHYLTSNQQSLVSGSMGTGASAHYKDDPNIAPDHDDSKIIVAYDCMENEEEPEEEEAEQEEISGVTRDEQEAEGR